MLRPFRPRGAAFSFFSAMMGVAQRGVGVGAEKKGSPESAITFRVQAGWGMLEPRQGEVVSATYGAIALSGGRR
ncbi:hypothetical protein DLM45_14810 [Hyphomicrobium methylovorum]|nr:hypothetical protein [Hyphomicrobium methylovorum]